ncbi:MAG: NADH-quinone oxidoreductase subunit NuoK [Actinobacteria bacterium]|nr:NADH-quinone oxidoreductase subunit NuoK [Actinomycetota bacterium]
MSLQGALVISAALFGVGLYGVLSQQSFVMIMMGLELMVNGSLVATAGLWLWAAGGSPKGQVLAIVIMTAMAIEAAMGFALVTTIFRSRKADITEKLRRLKL